MAGTEAITDPELETVAWDLEPLVDGAGAEGVDPLLDESAQRAEAFAARYAGHIAELDGPGLAEAMRELEGLTELVHRAPLALEADLHGPRAVDHVVVGEDEAVAAVDDA